MQYSELEKLMLSNMVLDNSVYADLHSQLAANRLNKPVLDITPEERTKAKQENFLALYSTNQTIK